MRGHGDQLKAVVAAQSHIDNDQVGVVLSEKLAPLLQRGGANGAVPRVGEQDEKSHSRGCIVFDDEDSPRHVRT
jgi:hypothetical protein